MRVDLPRLNSPSTETWKRRRATRSANRSARVLSSGLPVAATAKSLAAFASSSSSLSMGATSYRA